MSITITNKDGRDIGTLTEDGSYTNATFYRRNGEVADAGRWSIRRDAQNWLLKADVEDARWEYING